VRLKHLRDLPRRKASLNWAKQAEFMHELFTLRNARMIQIESSPLGMHPFSEKARRLDQKPLASSGLQKATLRCDIGYVNALAWKSMCSRRLSS
jgi:hypothetical protein